MIVHSRQPTPFRKDIGCRQPARLEGIPLDIIHLVANYSSIVDMVALSAVSKRLRVLLSDPGIWRKFYARNVLLLPPGPYDWQSTSYLVNALLRARKLGSVWPSSLNCPEIHRVRSIGFGCDATWSVLLGRWLFVAEGSTVVCYDSQCSSVPEPVEILFDAGDSGRILRVFSAGRIREDGVMAFVVFLFKDSVSVTKVVMDRGKPSGIQTVLTFMPTVVKGWTDSVDVWLYDRVLVVNIGKGSSGCKCCDGAVIMDVDTLRQYHVPSSTNNTAFHVTHTVTYFFGTKTHLVRVMEFTDRHKIRFKMECFPIPPTDNSPESDVLHASHESRVVYGPKLRQCSVIHESAVDSKTGKMSFALCGLNKCSNGNRLEIMEITLEPDGNMSFVGFAFSTYFVTSFCIGPSGSRAYGVGLGTREHPIVFAFNYDKPGSFSFSFSVLDRVFPAGEVLGLDSFTGVAFFTCRSGDRTSVLMVDFARDVRKAKGHAPEYVSESQLKITCDCGDCYLSG